MAKVKIKIEVNPNADDEELGNIQNQVNNTPSLENVSNVSVKIRGDGIYEEIPSNSGGINGLSLGYALVFDENGYLDNTDLEGGVLESTENPVEFVWGVVPESGEYTVRLTFTDAQSLKDITIFGDSEVNQFPTRAIIDGYKEITNDDLTWYINFGNEASTHTIEFTHWNKVNYNACLSKIGITLQYIEIDKTSGLKSVDSTSQSSTDTTGIFYGTVENRGSLEILDKTGELVEMLKDGIIDNSNTKIEIVANNESVQTHISTDSTYNANSQVMSLDLGNRLSSLDILKYKGYDYPDHSERLSVLLFDVLSNLRYALFGKDKELTEDEFKQMLSAKYDSTKTLYDYLYSIEVQYPVIEANKTYREVIDEFCLIAQMQMYIDDDNNIKFVTSRPKYFGEDLQAIHIPKKNMFSQLDYAVILKNKYDGVQIEKLKSSEQYELGVNVFEEKLETSSNLSDYETSTARVYNTNYYYFLGSGIASNAIIICDYSVKSGSLYVKKESKNYNLTKVLSYETKSSDNRYNYSLKYKQSTGSCRGVFEVGLHESDSVANSWTQKELNSYIKSESNKIFEGQIGGDQYTYTYSGVMGDVTATATLPFPFIRQSMIIRDEDNDGFWVDYKLIVGRKIYKLGGSVSVNDTDYYGELIAEGDFIEEYPEELTIFLKGDQYSIVFENESIQSSNFENSENSVSLSSNLVSLDNSFYATIKNNILSDYKQGISNATVSISCNDYFDNNGKKVINWTNGEILQVDQIVYFDNDLYKDQSQRYWKIKGRTFRKTGVPMVDLQLEETKIKKSLSEYSWNEINEISKLGYASSEFSLGDKKTITLQDGREVTAVIIGFNHDTISSDGSKAGITFAVADLNQKSATSNASSLDVVTVWINSLIRKEFLPNIYSNMPIELQNNIKNVTKVSLNGDVGEVTEDNLWLFSISELGGHSIFGKNYDEGKEYKYYSGTLQDLVFPKSAYWWLRSCFTHNDNKYATYIITDYEQNGFSFQGAISSYPNNVMFGFCI